MPADHEGERGENETGANFSLYTIFIDKVKKKCWSFLGEKKKFAIIWIPIHYEEIEFKVCWHWQLIFTSYSSMVSRQHCSIILSQVYSFFLQLLMADFCIDGKCHFPLPNKQIYTNETMIKILKEKSVVEIKGVLEKINKCQLCDLEIGLLCAILLIDPGT